MSSTSIGASQPSGLNIGASQYTLQGTTVSLTYGTITLSGGVISVIAINPVTVNLTYGTITLSGGLITLNRQKSYIVYQNDRIEIWENDALVWSFKS